MEALRPLASQGLASYGMAGMDAVEDLQANVSEGLASISDAGGGGCSPLADAVSRRTKHFGSQFARRAGRVEEKVGASSAALRGQVLNSVIMADANARSEIPALARAVAATAEQTRAKLAMYESRTRAMPQLRHQLLEACAEKKLRMERRYLAENAPVEDRHAAEVRRVLDGKAANVKRRTQPQTPSLLGYN